MSRGTKSELLFIELLAPCLDTVNINEVPCPSKYKGLLEDGTDPTKKLQKGAKKVTRVLQEKHGRKAWRTELLEGERRNGSGRLGAESVGLCRQGAHVGISTGISRREVYL